MDYFASIKPHISDKDISAYFYLHLDNNISPTAKKKLLKNEPILTIVKIFEHTLTLTLSKYF